MCPPEHSYRRDHRVYLLSLWREGEAGSWRAALRPAGGGPRRGFADLEQFAAYVLRLAEDDDWERGPPERDDPPG